MRMSREARKAQASPVAEHLARRLNLQNIARSFMLAPRRIGTNVVGLTRMRKRRLGA